MSGPTPPWLEKLLGLPPALSGEGAVFRLDARWPWAPWVTVLFAAASVALVAYCYAREGAAASRFYRGSLAAMRLALALLLLVMIAELSLSLERTGLPTVAVLVDDSASMSLKDENQKDSLHRLIAARVKALGLADGSRLNQAKCVLLGGRQNPLAVLSRDYKLRLYFVSETARHVADDAEVASQKLKKLEATGTQSRLGDGLRAVLGDLRGAAPAAIIILSDGIATDGESLSDAARHARRKGVPLLVVGLGSTLPTVDVEAVDLLVDEVVFIDDMVRFELKLQSSGLANRAVEVRLHEKGSAAILAREKVVLSAGGAQTVALPYRPTQEGEFEYVVEVEHLPDDVHLENDSQTRMVSVRKQQIRVLLAQSYPNYEYRYLKNMLEREKTVKLSVLLQEADLEYADIDPSALRVFPVQREELFGYDVLLLGDLNPSLLSAATLRNVADFVTEKGGGIAIFSGPRHMPLEYRGTPIADILPLDLAAAKAPDQRPAAVEPFRPVPTEQGLAAPQMQLADNAAASARLWSELPEMYWLLEAPRLKGAARVMAEHPIKVGPDGRKLPVFVAQYVGAGKVLFHATDETYRWRYRMGDAYFARYWMQAVRYLSRGKLLSRDRSAELTSDRREYRRGEAVRLRVRFFDEIKAPADDDGVVVVLERGGYPNQKLQLARVGAGRGVFETLAASLPDGRFHAWMAAPALEGKAPSADFVVTAPPGEFERTQMDAEQLRAAANETRGRYYTFATADGLLADLPPGRQAPLETLPPKTLWNRSPVLALFLALLVGEWLLRKRKGML